MADHGDTIDMTGGATVGLLRSIHAQKVYSCCRMGQFGEAHLRNLVIDRRNFWHKCIWKSKVQMVRKYYYDLLFNFHTVMHCQSLHAL